MKNYCVVCSQKNCFLMCKKCSSNPFKVEKCRQILAKEGNSNDLKKTYSGPFSEITNLNTSSFWNERLDGSSVLANQDGMTRDRIRAAFSCLPKSVRRVLDVGVGYGFIEEYLPKDIEIYGNDISNIAIKNIKNKFKGNFRKESVYSMKYSKGFFDAVFMLEVLEHIPPSKILLILKKIKKIIKERGILIISIPLNEGLEKMSDNPNGHVREYTKDLIEAELKICGFRVIETKVLYAFKTFYYLKKIIAKILKNRWRPNNITIKAESS